MIDPLIPILKLVCLVLSLHKGFVIRFLLETLSLTQNMAPHRAASSSLVTVDLEGRHQDDPRGEGGWLASFLVCHINWCLIPTFQVPVSLSLL